MTISEIFSRMCVDPREPVGLGDQLRQADQDVAVIGQLPTPPSRSQRPSEWAKAAES